MAPKDLANRMGRMLSDWTGDRWMQAADGKKAHEPQYWVCYV